MMASKMREKRGKSMSRFLQATCLKPRYSLRFQLFASFGVTAACAIGVVVLAATLTARSSGEALKAEARELLSSQVVANAQASSQHAADTLSKKFENLEGVVSLLGEVTRDRIVGYPTEGWQNDDDVPFLDTVSGRSVYPLRNGALPSDWDIDVNVNLTNYDEHVHDRWSWYAYPITTASGNYRIQGSCDPAETDPYAHTYYQNCTAANNDFSTGGVVQPTETNQYLAEKASDLAVFLKPLYETHTDVKHLGVYFANSGAGSSLVYPGYHIDGRSSYVSEGCDWMREINPFTGMAYGTEEEIARCHPVETRVPGREYNPLERQWCRDQALNPGKAEIVGPYLDAFMNDLWLLTVGKPVFDRMTGHFLGCTLLDLSIAHISEILDSVQLDIYADIALLRWDDGTVVYSPQWNASASRETITVSDLDFCDDRTFQDLLSLVDFDKTWNSTSWNATEIKDIFRTNIYTDGGQLIAAFPIPDPPEVYDRSYRPDFIVVQAVGQEIYSLIDKMESSIDEDIVLLNVATVSIGVVGLSIVLLVSWVVAVYLTRPLYWMMEVCRRIVHYSSEKGDGSFYEEEEIEPLVRCSPSSEITSLVSEFESTIKSFSGNGPASVASPDVNAVLNKLNWDEDFGHAYLQELYENPVVPIGEGGPVERRISFASSSIASHTSVATIDIDESSNDQTDSDEQIDPIADTDAVVESQAFAAEKESSLSSIAPQNEVALLAEPKDIDANVPERERKGTSVPPVQAKMPEKPTHLFTCSESCRTNKGYITTAILDDNRHFENELRTSINHNQIRRSPLFWWIILLVVIPIILTMTLICAIVTLEVTTVLPSWLEEAEAVSITLEKEYVKKGAVAHTVLTQEIFNPPIMDLHLLTRMASWLTFGGLDMSSSFLAMEQGTEECKTFPNDGSCPFFADPARVICDCSWKDSHDTPCQEYSNSRFLQKQHFAVQAQDADETGARVSTSYPAVDFSPSETLWWDDITKMPGYSNDSLTHGYGTVFDRTRIMSALTVVNIPLYNYRSGGVHRKHLGIYIGWEDDGMLAGYSGCDISFPGYAHFRSTPENGASKISPTLCPLWKYGYDSRCRGWYDEGKRTNSLHLTAPYVFAGTNEVANSVTLPLVDPESGNHVGQTLIDFFPSGLQHATSADDRHANGFVILITPESDALGGDTLVGPGYTTNSTALPIQRLVLPCDYEDSSSENLRHFEDQVLSEMKNGSSLDTTFRRRILLEDGSCDTAEEELFISYKPVIIRELNPIKPNEFARGVQVSDTLMASMGYIVPMQDLYSPFQAINDQVDDDINRSIAILIGVIAATAVITTFFLAMITISIVKPVTILLEFVILINKKHTLYDAPSMQGGSREVNQVYASLSKLHKIVRYSNMAFFSGKIKSAYRLLMDALSLFRGADDQKAIGIASNNLGNTLLAIRNQKLSKNTCFKVDGTCVQRQALASYNEAIELSTKEYEQSLHGADSADFSAEHAEQLANRYFNRGLFFFLTSEDHCADPDFIERGENDLIKAREIDETVRNLWVEKRQVHKNSVLYFERLLRRANGLIDLMQKGIIDGTSWGIAQLLEEADSLLFVVWNVPGSPLFDALSPTGRLQQLEGAAIRFASCKGSTKEAARMSTRMLVEDEFIEEQAFNNAASALLSWFREERIAPTPAEFRTTELAIRRDIRTMLGNSKIASDAALGSINIVLLQDLASLDGCGDVLPSFVQKLSDSCSDDDFVILPQQGDSRKESMLTVQRKGDMDETDWVEECTKHRIKDVNVEIRRAVHLCCESEDLSENDTWIILTTDRNRWDSPQCRLSESHTYLISEIGQLNKARNTAVHFAIVSINAKNVTSEICSEVCRVSRESLYIDLQGGTEHLEDSLADVASLIIGGGKKACSIPQGITMERF